MDISFYTISAFSIILLFSIILSVEDIKGLSVKVFILWTGIICAAACQLIFNIKDIWIYLISGLFCGLFYFIIRKITKNKLGTADIWFGFFQGLFLLPQMIPVCLGAEVLASLCFIRKKSDRSAFPFIPFMSFGLITAFIVQIII